MSPSLPDRVDHPSGTSEDAIKKPSGAVFVGVNVRWSKRVGDLELNSAVAERWEDEFSDWNIEERTVSLQDVARLYRVTLKDGTAFFSFETDSGLQAATTHLLEFVGELREASREKIQVIAQSEFLYETALPFSDLVARLEAKILNKSFVSRLGASLKDLNYLVDLQKDGTWFQLNVGPVRAHEVPRRVNAVGLESIPDVAVYYQISRKAERIESGTDIREVFRQVFELGSSVKEEVVP